MKIIENKTATKEKLTYGELILISVKSPDFVNGQPQGFNYELNKKIKRVDDIIGIDKTVKEYSIEDADFEFIKSRVMATLWGKYSIEFLEFQDYINGIK